MNDLLHPIHDEIESYIYEKPIDIASRLSIATYKNIDVYAPNIIICTDKEIDQHCRCVQIGQAEFTDGIIKDKECIITYNKIYSATPEDPVIIPLPFIKNLTDATAEIGTAQFPEADSWAIEKKIGDYLNYVEGIPIDFFIKEVAGHTLQVNVQFTDVKEIPELTDEFIYTKVDPSCKTVAEYKEKIKNMKQEIYNYSDFCGIGQSGFSSVRENSIFNYNALDMDYMLKSFLKEICLVECKSMGFQYFDDYLIFCNKTFDEFKQENINRAINIEKAKLIRNYILAAEKIVPSEEEIKYIKFTKDLSDEDYNNLPENIKQKELTIAGTNIFIANNCNIIRPFTV